MRSDRVTTPDRPARLVVDASAAIAIAAGEPRGRAFLGLLGERRANGGKLLVPAFFWLEVVNVLALRYRFSPALVVQAVADLEKLRLETIQLDRPGLLATIDVVTRTGLSAYDAAYLALAESADAQLLTADHRLASAAAERALPLIGDHGIKERPQPLLGSWASWAGAQAYLKELRADLIGEVNG